MFINTKLIYILGPAIGFWVVVSLVVGLRLAKESDPVKRAWAYFKLATIGTGTMLMLLWFALPSTPSLSTFGYPAEVAAVSQPQRLLNYLQEYNRALVRTTEVVYGLLFLFVWWFLQALYALSKALTSATHREP